jgi:hypothetical protein
MYIYSVLFCIEFQKRFTLPSPPPPMEKITGEARTIEGGMDVFWNDPF